MTILKRFLYFISTIGLILTINTNSHSADNDNKGVITAKGYSKDIKKLSMSGKKNKALIVNALNRIDNECCSEAFKEKNKILEIKKSLNNCLDNKCHNKTYLAWVLKRPQKFNEIPQLI